MDKNIFLQLGLSPNETIVYDFLLTSGESSAGLIIKKTPLKRGVVYNVLKSLLEKELINQKKSNRVALFLPAHPQKLWNFIEATEKKLNESEKILMANMPNLISSFNLISDRPGIRMYEGRDGIVKVLNDSLTTKTEILTYADIEGMDKYLGEENDKYVEKRIKLGIKKRGVVANTPFARKYLKNYDENVTKIRLIDEKKFPLSLEMEIYDNKVSFMTFSEKKIIGVIIENEEIYQTQKSIFEMIWENATPSKKIITPKPSRFEAPVLEAK